MTYEQFGQMLPERFYRLAKAKIKERDENWKIMDLLNAIQCSLFANAKRAKGTSAFTAEDFQIFREKKKSTPEEITAVMDRMAKRQEDR